MLEVPQAHSVPQTLTTCRTLLHNDDFKDAIIKCGDREWNIHRCILICHSKFFKQCWRREFSGVQGWAGKSNDLMVRLVAAFDSNSPSPIDKSSPVRQDVIDLALRRRAQIQLRLHWQHRLPDAQTATTAAAAKTTLDSLFSNFEMCHVLFNTARAWVKGGIDSRVGKDWTTVSLHERRTQMRAVAEEDTSLRLEQESLGLWLVEEKIRAQQQERVRRTATVLEILDMAENEGQRQS